MPATTQTTVVRATTVELAVADLGAENPLPPLASLQQTHQVRNLDELPPDMAHAIGYGHLPGPLPYLLQDGYGRDRENRRLDAVVVENDHLRATVLPGLGGRLHSLWDKETERELLFANPVFQPANLALRNAWFAGGVEWNLGTTGHTTLTCAPLHASTVDGPDGVPVLRLWEWERTRDLVYQLDFWLPADSRLLLVGVRVRNPHAHDVPAYWWSNIAVAQTPSTRVLAPADTAWHFDHTQRLERIAVPEHRGFDASYPMRHGEAADFFYELPEDTRPWIAAVDGDGRGLAQLSTDRLRGRKLFVWGENPGGRRWQEWLAPGAAGHGYLEIQAGLARTQLEHLRLPADTAWDWLEAYGPVAVDPAQAHHSRWSVAVEAAGRAVDDLLARERLAERFERWQAVADTAPGPRLHKGSGWGALELERMRRAGRVVALPGTPFDDGDLGRAQVPWWQLLDGAMPEAPPAQAPPGTLVSPPWRALLENAEPNWLVCYHRGVARWYAGQPDSAMAAWRRSIELTASPWAMRNLAVGLAATGRVADAAELLTAAVRLAPHLVALAVEAATVLLDAGRPDCAATMLDDARSRAPRSGRVALLTARALLALGDLPGAQRVFDSGFEIADLREGERSLHQAWRELQKGRGTDAPLPIEYDFSMTSE